MSADEQIIIAFAAGYLLHWLDGIVLAAIKAKWGPR